MSSEQLPTFEECHGVEPSQEELDKLIETYGIGVLDQWKLCCCKCERCKPYCKCGEPIN